jgi:hypothetical protein
MTAYILELPENRPKVSERRYMKRVLCVTLVGILLCGCAKPSGKQTAKANVPAKKESSAQTLINGFTGRQAVKSGKKASGTIKAVSAEQNKDLNEVMGGK